MSELLLFDTGSTDPAWNLAFEQYVFDTLEPGSRACILWQNRSSVIIGRYQNTYAEIDTDFVQTHDIPVVRRRSGGGAVYHDLGNLNYTLIGDAADGADDLHRFCQPLCRTLRALGLDAEVSGRNDLTVGGLKCSGSAQYQRHGRVMNHGAILFATDLNMLSRVLRVDETKLQAKGIPSVRSRVTNIRPLLSGPYTDLCLSDFRARLLEALREGQTLLPVALSPAELDAVEVLRRARYGSWDWNFGQSKRCDLTRKRRIEGCGTMETQISLDAGRILSLEFRGDFFSRGDPAVLAAYLLNARMTREDLTDRLAGIAAADYIAGLSNEQLIDLLLDREN